MKFNYNILQNKVIKKEAKIAVWGCGFVGTTTLLCLDNIGYDVLGIDTNIGRVNEIKTGIYNVQSEANVIDNYKERTINVVETIESKMDIDIHILCLPTEKDGEPYEGFILDVIRKISKMGEQFLLIVECSMPPRWMDEIICKVLRDEGKELNIDYIMGAAPRRDLFGNDKFSLSKTNRVIGACNNNALDILATFYSMFCESVTIAKDHYHAMFSKIVENTYRCFDISLANQLNLAFPNYDITHILELASTKWNVGEYHPSFGIGSYCVPLAPVYIVKELGNNTKSSLNIMKSVIKFNNNSVKNLFKRYSKLLKFDYKIGVFGISSIDNVEAYNCSIGLMLIDILRNKGYDVYVHDYYLNNNIKSKYQCITENKFNILDVVFILTPHNKYKELNPCMCFGENCIVIDSFGVWKDKGIKNYYEVGRPL